MHNPYDYDDLTQYLDRIDMREWQRADARMRMEKAALILDVLLRLVERIRRGGRVQDLLSPRAPRPKRRRIPA